MLDGGGGGPHCTRCSVRFGAFSHQRALVHAFALQARRASCRRGCARHLAVFVADQRGLRSSAAECGWQYARAAVTLGRHVTQPPWLVLDLSL
jgi:hypothetical protein